VLDGLLTRFGGKVFDSKITPRMISEGVKFPGGMSGSYCRTNRNYLPMGLSCNTPLGPMTGRGGWGGPSCPTFRGKICHYSKSSESIFLGAS